jgi:hypothetical protein
VENREEFMRTYRQLIEGLMGPLEGFCYTQLTDVEREQNGLLTFERVPKISPELIRPITQTPKRQDASQPTPLSVDHLRESV